MQRISGAWWALAALALAAFARPCAADAQATGVQPVRLPPTAATMAAEPTYALAAGVVRTTSAAGVQELPIGCDGVALHREGARLYVACGARGVVVLSLANPAAPALEGRREFSGDVVALFSGGGRVWAQIARIEAQPIDAATDVQSAPAYSENALPPVPTAPGGALTPPAYAEQARPLDDEQAYTAPLSVEAPPNLMMPDRIPNIWRIGAGADLFIPIGTIGVGGLLDAFVTRHFAGPFMLRAQVSPLAFAFVDSGGGSAFGAHLLVGLDTQFLELALGIGAASTESTSSAFALVQSLRVGALDGLHLAVQTNVYVLDKRFEFGAVTGVVQIPVRDGWWFIARGGGGPVGFYFGDVGVRYRVHGDGGAGSFFVQGVLGGVGLFGPYTCDPTTYYCTSSDSSGPALGVGVEWRL
jgi:hypothetical protein